MPRKRPRGHSVLASLDWRERECLMNGYFPDLLFDSEQHHLAVWQSVCDELLALAPPWPEALFRFELIPRHGPRLSEVREAQLPDGRFYHRRWTEPDGEYFERHGLTPDAIIKGVAL